MQVVVFLQKCMTFVVRLKLSYFKDKEELKNKCHQKENQSLK